MRARSASKALIALAAVLSGVAASAPKPLAFSQAFTVAHAPRDAHVRVLFRNGDGAIHHLEMWRQGETRLRRDTDGVLTTFVQHRPGDTAYRLDLFDHRRRIHTVVDRDSLYRVGRFTDWSDLAHGIRQPASGYRLTAAPAAKLPFAVAAPCDWYTLAEANRTNRICWSAAEAFPIVILDPDGKLTWRVTQIARTRAAEAVWHPRFVDYVSNDATRDISGD